VKNDRVLEKELFRIEDAQETCVYVGYNEVKDFIAPNRLGLGAIKIVRLYGIHTEQGTDPALSLTIPSMILANCLCY